MRIPVYYNYRQALHLPGRVHHAVDPGLLALQPPAALHLHVRLDEVGGRGHELPEAAGAHARQHLLPHGEPILRVLPLFRVAQQDWQMN